MKRVRLPASRLELGTQKLDEEASHYVTRVHRLVPGAELELFDPDEGLVASARLVEPAARSAGAVVEVLTLRPAEERLLAVELAVCLGKRDKPEQALRDATVLGAEAVVLLESERVQGRGHTLDGERLRKVMIDAARQCGRASLPKISGPRPLEGWARQASGPCLVLTLEPGAPTLLQALDTRPRAERITLLVGPEGGLTNEELELLAQLGFGKASLGPLVLRAEVAVTVALGVARARSLADSSP